MRSPPPVRIELRRSRRALALIVAAHAATGALLALLPLPLELRIGCLSALIGAAVHSILRITGRRGVASLVVGIDRRMAATTRGGTACEGEVLADSYVGSRLTTIVWRPDGARRARTLLLLPDALGAEDFRRLRVVLRYGRSIEPASATSGADAG